MPNAIQYENVTFTVGGQNPQTKTVQVAFSVDQSTGLGTATASFTYTGVNGGTDTIAASLPAFGYTSNPATVVWQSVNGLFAVGDQISVGSLQVPETSFYGWTITSPQPFTSVITVNSLYWNHANHGATPGNFSVVTAQGAFSGALVPTQFGASNTFQMVLTGYFVVSRAGSTQFNWFVDDDYLLGIGSAISGGGSASAVSVSKYPGPYAGTTTPFKGYPLLMVSNRNRNGSAPAASYYGTLNFSAPGIYPFEIDFMNTGGAPSQLQLTLNGTGGGSGTAMNGTVIPPVTIVGAPIASPPGNQNLVLTPTGGNPNLLLQGQQVTLSLLLQNVPFITQNYILILEGNPGQIYIYNDPLSPTFSFQSYYGATPDGPSAAINDFTIVGDNTSWQGQTSLRWDAALSKFELYYNGSQALANNQLFAPNVQSTTLTITQEDIAWFNAAGPEYDVFKATSAGGGKFTNIPVYYLLNPNYPAGESVQVSPLTVVTGAPPPPPPALTPIRRVSWSNNIGLNGNAGFGPGTVLTIYGRGEGTLFPSTVVAGSQVILSGFVGNFPFNSHSGLGSTGPATSFNLNGTYTVQAVTSAVVGGVEVCPVFSLIAPGVASTRSLDFHTGSGSGVVVTSGWSFLSVVPPSSTATSFTVTLARPLPPSQNNTILGVSFSGTQPTGTTTVTPNFATIAGVANWLVSYTVKATYASAAVASTSTMTFSFTAPSITFLGGSYNVTAAANTSGGNTAYAGTFSPVPVSGSLVTIAGFVAHAGNNGTFAVQPSSSGSSLVLNNAAGIAESHVATATVLDAFTTKINYVYPASVPASAVITLQASGSTGPVNVSLTESNGGNPVSVAGIGTSTTLVATWVSSANNFGNTTFYITPQGGSRTTLGVVPSSSAVITSIGGGKYQAVYTLVANTSAFTGPTVYQFSYLGACTDNSSVSYTDTNFYSSNN